MKELKYLDYTKGNEGHILIPSCKSVYPDMGVGTAQAIQTNIHESDSTPYVFRPTPYNSTRESGDIVGASVPWNQLVHNGNFANTTGWAAGNGTLSASNNELTYTAASDSNGKNISTASGYAKETIAGHKYFYSFDIKVSTTSIGATFEYNPLSEGRIAKALTANTYTTLTGIVSGTGTTGKNYFYPWGISGVTTTGTETVNAKNFMVIDLTLALGSAIADYIYNLESGTAGAGVAKLREWGFFTKPYYDYNAGGIESVNVSKHRMVGFNQWDEEWEAGSINDATGGNSLLNNAWRCKGYIPVIPGATYYHNTDGYTGNFRHFFYGDQKDQNGDYNFLRYTVPQATSQNGGTGVLFTVPNDAHYMRFRFATTLTNYKNCINISNPAINGTYEPYEVNEYALPTDDLRGVYKLDANNNLYAYGDVRYPNGKTDRKYGIVKGNLLSWTKTADGIFTTNSIPRSYGSGVFNVICGRYASYTGANSTGSNIASLVSANGNAIYMNGGSRSIYVADSAYTDATAFTNSLADVDFVYELATPTEETADPYNEVQVCSPYGTEEFVDAGVAAGTRDVAIPVGHNTEYMKNIVGAIEGIPLPPSANGTYTLKVTVASGVPTYSWVSG